MKKPWSQKSRGTVPSITELNINFIQSKYLYRATFFGLNETPNYKEKTTLQIILQGLCMEMNII